jgi:hypothetical protein
MRAHNSKTFGLCLATALTACAVVVASGPASAAKMTYEQAFKACKAEVDKKVPKSSQAQTENQRATTGTACMKKHGFKLKGAWEY